MVVPQRLREALGGAPTEVFLIETPEGLLLQPVGGGGRVRTAEDGLPVLDLPHAVTNEEVLAAIDRERER